MKKINWENGTVVRNAYVTIDETDYDVTPKQVEGTTPLSADNLNLMQNNIESAIDSIININSVGEQTGSVRIGNIGVEWGTLNVTPSSGSGSNYYGGANVTFLNVYREAPVMVACAGQGSTSIKNVSTFSITTTKGTVWISSSDNTGRLCRYLVIGVLSEEEQ